MLRSAQTEHSAGEPSDLLEGSGSPRRVWGLRSAFAAGACGSRGLQVINLPRQGLALGRQLIARGL